ncbi:MAG: hypothetical protein FJ267_03910 [Planctomycetes bacterium]|nr:hypothetical protein [Planctomycetota bacterium]
MSDLNSKQDLPNGVSIKEHSIPDEDRIVSEYFDLVVPTTVSGTGKIKYTGNDLTFSRSLYRVDGCSIKWIGVVLPEKVIFEPTPLIFFTPQPANGNIQDGDYDKLGPLWYRLFWNYSYWMGSQMAAAHSSQTVMVIPLYKNSQATKLGDFNVHWEPIVREILTKALNKKDPLIIRADKTSFKKIYTASYSSGVAPHQHFHKSGENVVAMTKKLFALDGKIGSGNWIDWTFPDAIVYKDRPATNPNPRGNVYFLANRWFSDDPKLRLAQKNMLGIRDGFGDSSHWLPAQFMLYHGLITHAKP